MKPRIYFDIEVRADARGDGLVIPIMERAFGVLHGAFREFPSRYAIALPHARSGTHRHPGSSIRVFSETREALDSLVSAIQSHSVVRDYLQLGYPRRIPDGFDGPWHEYRRYRITNRSSRLEKCREFRLRQAEELPYLRSISKTNGHGFGVYIAIMNGGPANDCQPDSYGLSVASRPFTLPAI